MTRTMENQKQDIEWSDAKMDALEKIKNLPEFSDEDILNNYQQLLLALREPEVVQMQGRIKAFVLHERFPQFAMGFGALFNQACLRKDPMPLEEVKKILQIARLKKDGQIPESKARGIVGDLAESRRRNRDAEHNST